MPQRAWWWQGVAYALLALAIAATALAFAVSQAWNSPLIPGAAPGYRYLALGYQRPKGVSFTTVLSSDFPALAAHLPARWHVGLAPFWHYALGPRAGKDLPQVKVGTVFGDYMQALHLRPLAGRLIDLRDQRDGAPVIVLSQATARRWFGGAGAAIGRAVHDGHGLTLHVVGVLPEAFGGTDGRFSSHPVQAWIPGTLMPLVSNGFWPTKTGKAPTGDLLSIVATEGWAPLLSLPADVGAAQLRSELARVLADLGDGRPADAQGFAWAAPYTLFPEAQKATAKRIRLFLDLSVAAFVLAAINVLVLRWLGYLRRRNTLQLERILGARGDWLVRRLLWRGLATLLVLLLLATAVLVVLGALLLRRLVAVLDPVLTPHALFAPLTWILPIVLVLAMLVELLPMLVLLSREHLDDVRTVSGMRGDRAFGSVLLAAEVLLGMVIGVLAAWTIGYAWHAAHEQLGMLDRSASFVDLDMTRNIFGQRQDLHAQQAVLQTTLDIAAQVVPAGRALGFGPQIRPGVGSDMPITVHAGTHVISACVHQATPGWVAAAGLHVQAGTNFDAIHAQPDTVLLDARVADRLFGSARGALGQSVVEHYDSKPQRVVGVLAPVYLGGSRKDGCPVVFQDLRNAVYGLAGGPRSLAIGGDLSDARRAALRQRLDAFFEHEHVHLTVAGMRSTSELRDALAAQQITESRVFTLIALFAWAIALSGIVALLRLYLAQRRRLLAIESALGATPTRTYFSVVLGTLAVAGIGALIDLLLLPWLATQYALLSGAQVAPFGAATWIALAVLLLAVFLVAHFPARRAARAEPAQSLHEL